MHLDKAEAEHYKEVHLKCKGWNAEWMYIDQLRSGNSKIVVACTGNESHCGNFPTLKREGYDLSIFEEMKMEDWSACCEESKNLT